MTHDELQAIKARAEAATPGPWRVFETPSDSGHSVERRIGTVDDHPQLHGPEPVVTQFVSIDPRNGEAPWKGVSIQKPNAEFIAHARTDLPALVAEVERLRGALERLGSSEAFTYAMAINSDDPREQELRARLDFAREAMK